VARVIGFAPGCDDRSRFEYAVEFLPVEQIPAHGSMEGFDVPILLWSSFFDGAWIDALTGQPDAQLAGDELATVVGADDARPTVCSKQPFEVLLDFAGADRSIDQHAHVTARVLVNDIQDAIGRSVARDIVFEVQRPHVVRALRREVPDRVLCAPKRFLTRCTLRGRRP